MVRGGGIIILASRSRWQQHSARGIIFLASRWQQHSAGASSSLPVVGGNQTPHGIMSDWDVNGMVSLLESISLGHLSKAFIENGLDGAFFLQCSQEELAEIGLTALQFKKIMAYAPGGPKNQ